MLSAHPALEYIHEPLNLNITPETWGILPVERTSWYHYIAAHNEQQFLPAYKRLLRFCYNLREATQKLDPNSSYSPQELKVIARYQSFANAYASHLLPLVKDPFALVSVPWFADRLGMNVVVTIRHPAGFVSSLQRLGWSFGLGDFLAQPELMAAHPIPAKDLEANERFLRDGNEIAKIALGWKHLYRIVRNFLKSHPHLIYVRHRDLALQPVEMFRLLLEKLELEWTPEVEKTVVETSAETNPHERELGDHHNVNLDSKAALDNWKKRLKPDQIETIQSVVEEVAADYYTEEEW